MDQPKRFRKAFYEKENRQHTHNINTSIKEKAKNMKREPRLTYPNKNLLINQVNYLGSEEIPNINLTKSYLDVYGNEQAINGSQCKPPKFLKNHQVDEMLRARMLDWMVEVTSSYKFSPNAYFKGVHIMDRYFHLETAKLVPNQLHLIGITCMWIASKMDEVRPLKIKTVFERIGHRKFSIQDLTKMEAKIASTLNYQLLPSSFYDKAIDKLMLFQNYDKNEEDCNLFLHRINKKIGEKSSLPNEKNMEQLQDLCEFLSKIVLFDYNFYCKHSELLMAEIVLSTVFEIKNITPSNNFFSSPQIALEMSKQEFIQTVQNFKNHFPGLGNIQKFAKKQISDLILNM